MSRKARKVVFIPAGIVFLLLFGSAIGKLPDIGHYQGPYGDVLNTVAVQERHSTDVVTAVNFDYRGFDTLGEESILFISVIGATVLLRKQSDEREEKPQDEARGRHVPAASDAVRVLTLGLAAPSILFGLYVVLHGQITPGGGFQGGVVLSTVPLLVYLAGDLQMFEKITSQALVVTAEAAGIAAYILIGLVGIFFGAAFLQNVFPLGPQAVKLYSGGSIPLINLATGVAVSAGFVLLMAAFLEETLRLRKVTKK